MLEFFRKEKKVPFFFIADFVSCFTNFLILPIFAIYLKQELFFSIVQIGLLMTIPPVIVSLFSSLNQLLLKRVGKLRTILIGIVLDMIIFFPCIIGGSYKYFIFFAIIQGIGRALWIPLFKSSYITFLKDKNNIDLVFKLRYIMICISAIFAPLFSFVIYDFNKVLIFYIGLCLFLTKITLLFIFRERFVEKETMEAKEKISLKANINVLLKNNGYFLYIIGSISILTVFSQFESTFSLAISETITSPEKIFSVLLIVNSIFGIIFQMLGMTILKKITACQNLIIGSIFFIISFFMFSTGNLSLAYLTITVILFTIGETCVLPNLDIIINEFSNEETRNLMYSVSEIKRIGFFIGPILSSYFIEKKGTEWMYISFTIIAMFGFFCFLFLQKKKTKEIFENKSMEVGVN